MSEYSSLLKQCKIIFENTDIVVVSKPSGLLSIADRYKAEIPNLKSILLKKYGEIFTVHRLDRDTSGVMVFARNEATHKFLNQQFANRSVKKTYWAFVNGCPIEEEGIIDIPIMNEMKNAGKMFANPKGKPAETAFKVIEKYGRISLIEYAPITGRTHQIRVHSKFIGCPLLIDDLYGNAKEFFLSKVKKHYKFPKWSEERPLVSRLTLHSRTLKFKSAEGEDLFFEAELPKDLSALKKQLTNLSN